ncbi:MAG TPA: YebC/PmpR family DNA-binding transcriptional regulator [Candidatus Subteraquimicrobiales bacterium]
MSGHSKWSQIKHKKGKEDAKRGQLFSRLSRAITVAAKAGGNPETNAVLEAEVQKAKDYNMPNDSIERAIKRGTGEIGGVHFEQIVYEGYGPQGVAMLVSVMTDNRNRAAADMRSIFTHNNGNLAELGSVSWIFEKKGNILVDKTPEIEEDTLFSAVVEAGAEDMQAHEDHWEITTSPQDLTKVRKLIEEQGITVTSAEITMLPKNTVKLGKNEAKKVLRLINALEEHEDVQEVYANFDIPDEILEEVAAEAA